MIAAVFILALIVSVSSSISDYIPDYDSAISEGVGQNQQSVFERKDRQPTDQKDQFNVNVPFQRGSEYDQNVPQFGQYGSQSDQNVPQQPYGSRQHIQYGSEYDQRVPQFGQYGSQYGQPQPFEQKMPQYGQPQSYEQKMPQWDFARQTPPYKQNVPQDLPNGLTPQYGRYRSPSTSDNSLPGQQYGSQKSPLYQQYNQKYGQYESPYLPYSHSQYDKDVTPQNFWGWGSGWGYPGVGWGSGWGYGGVGFGLGLGYGGLGYGGLGYGGLGYGGLGYGGWG